VTVAGIFVVVPSFRRSWKVLPFMDVSIICSENMAVTLIAGATSDSLALGMVLTTLGSSVSEEPPAPILATLQVPHLQVHIQHQVLAPFREILERDLAAQLSVGRTATADRVAAGTERVVIHARVRILARLLQREKPSEDRRIALGGHAAVVVESDVARNAVR
jgi:hypothetical protein